MSLEQWQAWIEKDNEVQTDMNVTQKKLRMRGRQHTYGCIKWDMTVEEMSEMLEVIRQREWTSRKNNCVNIKCHSLSSGVLVWFPARGRGAWWSRTDVAPGICRSYSPSLGVTAPSVGISQGITDVFTPHILSNCFWYSGSLSFLLMLFHDSAAVRMTNFMPQCAKGKKLGQKIKHV